METVILVADPFPPYQYMTESGVEGLDYQIIRSAFKTQGLEVAVSLFPWDECIKRVEKGLADGIFQIAKTPQREEIFLFSNLLRIAKTVFYSLKDRPLKFNGAEDVFGRLQNLSIGHLEGYNYGAEFDNRKDLIKRPVKTHEELLNRLSRGDFDIALIDRGVATYLTHTLGLEGLCEVPGFQIDRPLYVAFRRDKPEILDAFNKGLDKIRKDGVYDRIASAYGLSV